MELINFYIEPFNYCCISRSEIIDTVESVFNVNHHESKREDFSIFDERRDVL